MTTRWYNSQYQTTTHYPSLRFLNNSNDPPAQSGHRIILLNFPDSQCHWSREEFYRSVSCASRHVLHVQQEEEIRLIYNFNSSMDTMIT